MFKLLYKPTGISSFKFINQYARDNNIKKIGHTGTLDPLAKGLLLVATNNDTKLIEYVKGNQKVYIAEGKFGIFTSSLDLGSPIIKRDNVKITDRELLIKTIGLFIGKQLQTPPQVSAKKIKGVRSYKMNLNNIHVEHKPVEIQIYDIQLLEFNNNIFKIKVSVSKGVYIRQLINDIALKLNTIATTISLERVKISGISLDKIDEDIQINKILNIDYQIINNIIKEDLINLIHGKEYKKSFNKKTLLIYRNVAIAIIYKKNPIKVFAENIRIFL